MSENLALYEAVRKSAELQRRIGNHEGMEAFLLEKGRFHQRGPLPPKWKVGKTHHCFKTATEEVLANPHLRYAEGLAFRPDLGIPIHHAWIVNSFNAVIDPTWKDPENCYYLGVDIGKNALVDIILNTGVYGILDQGRGFNRHVAQHYFNWLAPTERTST